MDNCEFCAELRNESSARFWEMYPNLSSRVVEATENFVAMPSIGQLFPGSLLVLPRLHIETSAFLSLQCRQELDSFLGTLSSKLRRIGAPVFFEHGATSCSGGGCGIYHAHVHIVPLPRCIEPKALFPEFIAQTTSFGESLDCLLNSEEYLLLGNEFETVHASINDMEQRPPSQFFRQRLVKYFNLRRPWDWRKYQSQEKEVLETIKFFNN